MTKRSYHCAFMTNLITIIKPEKYFKNKSINSHRLGFQRFFWLSMPMPLPSRCSLIRHAPSLLENQATRNHGPKRIAANLAKYLRQFVNFPPSSSSFFSWSNIVLPPFVTVCICPAYCYCDYEPACHLWLFVLRPWFNKILIQFICIS